MADNSNTRTATLCDLPSDISESYLKGVEISLKSRQQGYKYFSEGYFNHMKLLKSNDAVIQVSARCFRSQRTSETPNLINLDISPGSVTMAHCSCIAGSSGCCSHITGLLQGLQHWQLMGFTEVPGELSWTSLAQQWSNKVNNTMSLSSQKIKVTNADIKHFHSLNLPISYLENQPTKNVTYNTHLWEVNIGSRLSIQASFYEEDAGRRKSVGTNCGNLQIPLIPPIHMPIDSTLPEEKARGIECTRDQSNNSRWYERRQRITASKFFEVTKGRSFSDKYLTGLMNGKGVNSTATSYGKSNELKTRRAYITIKGNHVHDCESRISFYRSFTRWEIV